MTIIKVQHHDRILGMIIPMLFAVALVCAFVLVVFYNRLVNATHAAAGLNDRLRAIEAETTELRDKLFAATGSAELEALAGKRGLVKEKDPEYLPVDQSWLLASH
ncbi:MAG: hypothetical protein AAB867_00950 [Patescibacteria group bacterium]